MDTGQESPNSIAAGFTEVNSDADRITGCRAGVKAVDPSMDYCIQEGIYPVLHMSEAVLKINNLSRSFGGFTAVDALTFSVNAGEIFGLLGSNGAGKTTTIKMLNMWL